MDIDFNKYCSGVILYEETLYQKCEDGTPFVDLLNKLNVLPGIKVDKVCFFRIKFV